MWAGPGYGVRGVRNCIHDSITMTYNPIEHGSLNDFVRWRAGVAWEEWYVEQFADQDFSPWDRYRVWLVEHLNDRKGG